MTDAPTYAQQLVADYYQRCDPKQLDADLVYNHEQLRLWRSYPLVLGGCQRLISNIEQAYRDRGLQIPTIK